MLVLPFLSVAALDLRFGVYLSWIHITVSLNIFHWLFSSCIDTSDIEYCSPLVKSDHSLINFNFNCYIQHENTERVKYYYDKADFAGMKQELSTIDWER
jgi:hypothetical protein